MFSIENTRAGSPIYPSLPPRGSSAEASFPLQLSSSGVKSRRPYYYACLRTLEPDHRAGRRRMTLMSHRSIGQRALATGRK